MNRKKLPQVFCLQELAFKDFLRCTAGVFEAATWTDTFQTSMMGRDKVIISW
jgi:hypothetical protein